jgi:hypothetical protein
MAHAPDSARQNRHLRLLIEELEPRDLPSTVGIPATAAPLTSALQKLVTSELVMEFMVIVSSGAGSGLARGLLPIASATSPFPPSFVPPSESLGGAPLRLTPGAGVVLGNLPASLAKSVDQGSGGTATTDYFALDADDSGEDDTLALGRHFAPDSAHRAETAAAAAALADSHVTGG